MSHGPFWLVLAVPLSRKLLSNGSTAVHVLMIVQANGEQKIETIGRVLLARALCVGAEGNQHP